MNQAYEPKNCGIDQYKERFNELQEIYNEEMSPTMVELGYDQTLQQRVAIKHIYKDQLINDILRKQALLECSVHSQVKNDHLVELYDCFQTEKQYTLILEYMNDANYFKEKIDVDLKIISTEAKMKSYMTDVLEGLSYLHKQGIAPTQNLFCQKIEDEVFRNVKIGDLGLVHIYDVNTGSGTMPIKCGTASYIAPEICDNAMITPKIDIWSLGIILYKMSCGYKPTQIQGFKYGQGPIPFRKFDWKKRSKDLQNIIIQMLDIDPNNRPTCDELLQHNWFEIDS